MDILTFSQVAVAILLIIVILIQPGKAGMGSAFGEGETFHSEKRGVEKGLFVSTIVLGFIFISLALANLLL